MNKPEHELAGAPYFQVRSKVPLKAPLTWLARGWEDCVTTGFSGVFYGAVFVVMGYLITWQYANRWQLTMGLISGFLLMGPFICAGLYDLSRQRLQDRRVSILQSLTCWRNNPGSIAFFAVMLTFLMVIWARVSVIIFALSSSHHFATLSSVPASIFSLDNPGFVLLWTGIGFIFASVVFATGVISVPLMLDRNADTLMAVFTSARSLYLNPKPLYLWAVLIVLLIGTSLLLKFWPLLITAPVIGHATWHAYRDLVEPADS